MRKAIVVGLTGQTGTGKTTVGNELKKYGYSVIDADKVARLVTEKGSPTLKKLAEAFGKEIIKSDGTLDRALLADKAFSNEKMLELLNSITHPEIVRLIMKKVNGEFFNGFEGVIIDAPQLFESGLDKKCNMIIAVTAPENLRLERIMKRDGISEEPARKRMAAQLPEEFFTQQSDIVVVNDGDNANLAKQVLYAARKMEEKISGEAEDV